MNVIQRTVMCTSVILALLGKQAYEVRNLQGALLEQGMVGERGEVDLAKSPAGILLLTLHNEVIRVVKLP